MSHSSDTIANVAGGHSKPNPPPHKPTTLFLGCSDARVPESVLNLPPETQIFVHRNIAKWVTVICFDPLHSVCLARNATDIFLAKPLISTRRRALPIGCLNSTDIMALSQYHLTDPNAGAVLTYGLAYIQGSPITDVYVVGHTDCGGVKTCYNAVRGDSSGIPPDSVLWTWLGPLRDLAKSMLNDTVYALTEKNVQVQVVNVQTLLNRLGKPNVRVHGCVYNVETKKLKHL